MPTVGQLAIPFARGSHTSYKSARRIDSVQRQTKTRRYLALLYDRALIDEVAAGLLGCKQSSICSIRWSLSQRGLIRKAGEQIAPLTGESCTAWELTAEGRRQVER